MEKRTKCSNINDITTICYKSSKFYSTKVLRKFITPSGFFFFLQSLTTYIQICISHWYWNILTEVFKIIGLLNIYLLQQILHQKRCYPLSLDHVDYEIDMPIVSMLLAVSKNYSFLYPLVL